MPTGKLWMAPVFAILITGCSPNDITNAHRAPSYGRILIYNEVPPDYIPASLNAIVPAAGVSESSKSSHKPDQRPDCSLRDRFDRKSAIAYNFADGKSRLGLHVDIDGPGLSDPGELEVEGVMLNFRYRFQPVEKKREKCLYRSAWQGLLGSGYNEFFERESDTVYEQLDDEFDNFADELEQHF